MRRRVVLIAAVLLLGACGDGGQIADLEAEVAAANDQIAALEDELFDATSTTTTTTTTAPPTRIITGTITLTDIRVGIPGGTQSCYGTGGFDDMLMGAEVVVRDGSGTIIGTSSLERGEGFTSPRRCVFPFAVEVPADSDFYEVEASHRGGIAFSNADLEAQEWTVSLTLG